VLFQEYVNAALMLMAMHAPLNSGNPYSSLNSESGFSTFDFPQVQVLAAEVTARAQARVVPEMVRASPAATRSVWRTGPLQRHRQEESLRSTAAS
jgi:hypothetical protein